MQQSLTGPSTIFAAPLCGLLPFLGAPTPTGMDGGVLLGVVVLDEYTPLASFSNPPYRELMNCPRVPLSAYANAASRDFRICSIESGIGVPKPSSSSVGGGGGVGVDESSDAAEENLRTKVDAVLPEEGMGQNPKQGLAVANSSSSSSSWPSLRRTFTTDSRRSFVNASRCCRPPPLL